MNFFSTFKTLSASSSSIMCPQLSIISTWLPSIKDANFLPSLTGHILSSVASIDKVGILIFFAASNPFL